MKEIIKDDVGVRGYYVWDPVDIISCLSSKMSRRYGFIYVSLDDYGKGSGKGIRKDSYAWMQKTVASNGEDLG